MEVAPSDFIVHGHGRTVLSQVFLFYFLILKILQYYIGLGARTLVAGLTSSQTGLWLPSPAAIFHRTGRGWASVLSCRTLLLPLSDALSQGFLEPLYTLKIVAGSVLCVCVLTYGKFRTFTKVEKTIYQTQLQ